MLRYVNSLPLSKGRNTKSQLIHQALFIYADKDSIFKEYSPNFESQYPPSYHYHEVPESEGSQFIIEYICFITT